jgi:hypothetical protein
MFNRVLSEATAHSNQCFFLFLFYTSLEKAALFISSLVALKDNHSLTIGVSIQEARKLAMLLVIAVGSLLGVSLLIDSFRSTVRR